MRVISIGIGFRHLTWCMLETTHVPPKVNSCSLKDISHSTIRDAIDQFLDQIRPELASTDAVLIEQQPLHHSKRLAISYALYGAFRQEKLLVEFVNPKERAAYLQVEHEVYTVRKKITKKTLADRYRDTAATDPLGNKIIDFADTVLQAIVWIDRKRAS